MNKTLQQSFLIYICLVLPHSIIGMKRHSEIHYEHSSKKPRTTTIALRDQQTCPELPYELWVPIAISDLSSIKNLRLTCSTIYNALKIITVDFLDKTIAENPKTAQGIAQNFYLCTKLFYKYGTRNDQDAFNTLWNNQSVADKGIRTHFAKWLTLRNNPFSTTAALKVFNDHYISLSQSQGDDLMIINLAQEYLITALRQKNPQKTDLATSFFLHNHVTLNEPIYKHHIERNRPLPLLGRCKTTSPLREACRRSTPECLQILLDYGADTNTFHNDEKSTLHHILSKNIEDRLEKINLILKAQCNQKCTQHNNIVDHIHQNKTPLIRAIDLFAEKLLSLEELMGIIKTLLHYGANPTLNIIRGYDLSYTVFDKINMYTEKNNHYSGVITVEEEEIILDCLKNSCP